MSKSKFDYIKKYQDEFESIMAEIIREALCAIKSFPMNLIPTYCNWTAFGVSDKNNLPVFGLTASDSPKNYSRLFNKDNGALRRTPLSSMSKLEKLFMQDPELISRAVPYQIIRMFEESDEVFNKIKTSLVHAVAFNAIEIYAHKYGLVYEQEKAYSVVSLVAKPIFSDELEYDICIPILFVNFGFEQHSISENIEIRSLTHDEQLSRSFISPPGLKVDVRVLGASTHGLFIKQNKIPNMLHDPDGCWFDRANIYPSEIIDSFFASMRVVTGCDTGYAQMLCFPNGWSTNSYADLPSAHGLVVNRYPAKFNEYFWNNNDIALIDKSTMQEISNCFNTLLKIQGKSLYLAAKRLSLSMLREKEADAIVDAVIGIESLLSSSDNQGMTHKVAMRGATLFKLHPWHEGTPKDVFFHFKDIYSCRSKIVHGKSADSKLKDITLNGRLHPTHIVANEYLRQLISIIIKDERYQNPDNIDFLLFD